MVTRQKRDSTETPVHKEKNKQQVAAKKAVFPFIEDSHF
jgi:hypothetical protein